MPDNNLPAVQYYTPVELVGIYRSFLERARYSYNPLHQFFSLMFGSRYVTIPNNGRKAVSWNTY